MHAKGERRLCASAADPTDPSLGTLLKAARQRAGMTQRQLADLSSVSVRTVRDIELHLTIRPRKETVRLLLDGLRLRGVRRAELERAALGPAVSFISELGAPRAALGPIIGRDHDVEAVTRLLRVSGSRLIRVAGNPGVGKSRLIEEVASNAYAHRLMPVVSADLPDVIIDGLDPSAGDRFVTMLLGEPDIEALIATVGADELLLVLRDAPSPRLEDTLTLLLERCPRLRVLCETRAFYPNAGGTVYMLFPLDVTEPAIGADTRELAHSPAMQLMLARCDRLDASDRSNTGTLSVLARICWTLDGLPQAIEAAASILMLYGQVKLLEVATVAPFELLPPSSPNGAGLRGQLNAQLTLLSSGDVDLLHYLAAAPSPWTVTEASRLLNRSETSTLCAIQLLCERGLVRPAGSAMDGVPRFTVLNLVRYLLIEGKTPMARGVDIEQAETPRRGLVPRAEENRQAILSCRSDARFPRVG